MPPSIFDWVVGIALLLCGRRLFWLFVAALGFAAGIYLTPLVAPEAPAWLALVISLGLGALGALLALLLQRVAIALAGFVAGGRIALAIAAAWIANPAAHGVVTFVLGGLIGALLMLALFDWALIVLSSIEGARLIVEAMHPGAGAATPLLVGLILLGVIVQAAISRRGKSRSRE